MGIFCSGLGIAPDKGQVGCELEMQESLLGFTSLLTGKVSGDSAQASGERGWGRIKWPLLPVWSTVLVRFLSPAGGFEFRIGTPHAIS